jgi:dihydroxy-acid dehydratase
MPLARTNAFGLVLYPGTSSPGRVDFGPWAAKGSNLTIMDYAEGRAAQESGRITAGELLELERNVMPGQRHLRAHVHRQHHEHRSPNRSA